jgi:hypothetical protein
MADSQLMLPPKGLPSTAKQRSAKNPFIPITSKQVLEEDDYLNALSHIIERDFYPTLSESSLKSTLALSTSLIVLIWRVLIS